MNITLEFFFGWIIPIDLDFGLVNVAEGSGEMWKFHSVLE